ncbi:2-dehydro-3-deoxygluconokinase [Rhodococcus sp. 27YEA15]|uniref:sugar kinase n=1 Tax=Rhodococcus sp. 27YEA15 TaxID=3156259 RepID=UPI003C7BD0E4
MTTAPSQSSRTEVVTLGETMALVRADTPGPLQHVSSLGLGMGGAESNFAIALRRLDTPVTWVGRIGADSFGEYIRRELCAERVTTLAIEDADAPTGLMIKERRTADSQKVWYYRAGSAGSRLEPADVPVAVVERARLLHVTGITPGLSDSAAAAVDFAVATAKAAGTLVAFDLNYRSALWSGAAAGVAFEKLCGQADLVFAGDDEAALVVGAADDPMVLAHRLAELGPTQVIVKLGARGAVALIDGVEYQQSAVPVTPIDTVGAGDAFVAGYISEFLAGVDPAGRLGTAARVGAFSCLVPGDWEGSPRRGELGLLDADEPVSR